jgi:predicted XRE-type DNA-binding protein
MNQRFKNAFDAISDTPEESANLRLKSALMNEIRDRVDRNHWNQTEAANHLGITQPRFSDLSRGKLSKFSLDSLVSMLVSIGAEIELRVA